MKKSLKRTLALVVSVCAICASAISVNASDDNHPYAYNIKAYNAPTYTNENYYRQTDSVNNQWKVNLVSSTEGNGDKMTFWMATWDKNHTVVCDKKTIAQGSGTHYYNPYSSANHKTLCLGMSNNNRSSDTWRISGYWDEEVW